MYTFPVQVHTQQWTAR